MSWVVGIGHIPYVRVFLSTYLTKTYKFCISIYLLKNNVSQSINFITLLLQVAVQQTHKTKKDGGICAHMCKVCVCMCAHPYSHICTSMWRKTCKLPPWDICARHAWTFGQIGVLFCHSSPEIHFPSIHSLWREGLLPAVLSEVKVIRFGMRSRVLWSTFFPVLSQCSLHVPWPQLSFQVQKYILTIMLPQTTSGIFLLYSFSAPFFSAMHHKLIILSHLYTNNLRFNGEVSLNVFCLFAKKKKTLIVCVLYYAFYLIVPVCVWGETGEWRVLLLLKKTRLL